MKKIILFTLLFTMISCGNDTKNNVSQESNELVKEFNNSNQIITMLKKPAIFSALVENLEFVGVKEEEYISIQNFILLSDKMNCVSNLDQEICQQILKTFKESSLSFTSNKESNIIEEFSERYSINQEGVINIGENTYQANLYFSCIYQDGTIMFSGKLVFNLPGISLLKERPVVIDIKGKK